MTDSLWQVMVLEFISVRIIIGLYKIRQDKTRQDKLYLTSRKYHEKPELHYKDSECFTVSIPVYLCSQHKR